MACVAHVKVVILEKKPENLYFHLFLSFFLCVCVVVSICTHNAISFEYQWNMKGERKDADINPMVLKKRLETLYNNFIRFGLV